MYQNTTILIRKDRINDNRQFDKAALYHWYIDKIIKDWFQVTKQNILAKDLILNAVLFMGEQVIEPNTEDEIEIAVFALNNIAIKYNLKISVNETKPVAVKGKMNVRTKIVINKHHN
jgi:hypothetical protein